MSDHDQLWKDLDGAGNSALDENTLRKSLSDIAKAAYDFANNSDFAAAYPLYAKAIELALIVEREKVAYYLDRAAYCLSRLYRYEEALVMLMRIPETDDADPMIVLNNFFEQINLAIRIAINHDKIEKLIRKTDDYISSANLHRFRASLLLNEADFLCQQYSFAEAINMMLEGVSLFDTTESPQYSMMSFNDLLFYAYQMLDDLPSMKKRYDLAKNQESFLPNQDSRVLSMMQARIYQREKKYEKACKSALNFLQFSKESGQIGEEALLVLIDVLVSANNLDLAREYIPQLCKLRHIIPKQEKYQIYLTIGNYYAALSQPQKRFIGSTIARTDTQLHHRERAIKFYRHALKLGTALDQNFNCTGRQRETMARLNAMKD